MLGPLDMGELPYHPSARGANGVDHFVLALHTEDGAVVVQDPAGYPAMPIDVEALDRAWWADLIEYRRGAYRRWHSPSRAGQSHLDKYKIISSKMWSFFSEGVTSWTIHP